MRRFHIWTARLAIFALLIDGLLPTAVAAAAGADSAAPTALCSAAAGAPQPAKHQSTLPPRHCALCTACVTGLLPALPRSLAAALTAEEIASPGILSAIPPIARVDYPPAQARAPPSR